MAYATSDFLADVRREGMLPSTSVDGTADADIFAQGQYELESRVVPLILKTRQEYFNVIDNQTITASRAMYRIPRRSIGGTVRNVTLVKSDGSIKRLFHLELEYIKKYYANTSAAEPEGYYFRGDHVVLVPAPNAATASAYTLQIEFPCRPGRMQADTAANYLTLSGTLGWSTNGSNYEIETVGTMSASSTALLDFVRIDSGFQYLFVDVVANVTNNGGTDRGISVPAANVTPELLYFYNTTPTTLETMYAVAANTISYVPVPVEFQAYLVQCTVARVKRQLGELEQAGYHEGVCQRMAADLVQMISPRDDGEPRKIQGGVFWNSKRPFYGLLR